jgi:spore coat polysaccharide biosynthesis predicted glycosyltransferase SpsG
MKRILFRADAKPSIGVGDLMSLITLSKYFNETWEVFFLIKSYKAALILVQQHQLQNVITMKENIPLEEEIVFINNTIQKLTIDILCLEITEIKLSSYIGLDQTIKKVAINFDGDILDNLDLLVNWDIDVEKLFDGKAYQKTKFLLGPQYVILPKEIYTIKKSNPTKRDKKLLIAMGGADEFNLTQKVIDTILQNNLNLKITIIVGAGYEYLSSLQNTLKNSNTKFEIKQNITNMIKEYSVCDIAIGAGGLTASELVAAKISTILIATYQHQIARCEYFEKEGLATYLGFKKFNPCMLIHTIKNPPKLKRDTTFNTFKVVEEIQKLVETK